MRAIVWCGNGESEGGNYGGDGCVGSLHHDLDVPQHGLTGLCGYGAGVQKINWPWKKFEKVCTKIGGENFV